MHRFVPVLLLLTLASLPLNADNWRICLGVVDPAGLPPERMPPVGVAVARATPAAPFTDEDGATAGYLPAVYREAVRAMRQDGIKVEFIVRHHYQRPRPGRFLQIEVWAETDTPDRVRPLHYALPVHPDPDRVAGR